MSVPQKLLVLHGARNSRGHNIQEAGIPYSKETFSGAMKVYLSRSAEHILLYELFSLMHNS